MTEQQPSGAHRVLIAGGGVAGLEALIALHRLAGDRVETTLLAPTPEYLVRALSVQNPFARPAPRRYPLKRIAADHGARFVEDGLAAVEPAANTAKTASGGALPFDSLLVAIGARPHRVYERVTTFRGLQDAEALHGLIQDVEGGYSTRIAFVVPPGVTWPLPLYELALLTAERAYGVSREVELTIVTPEPRPLDVFGDEAADSVARVLADAGVTVMAGRQVREIVAGEVVDAGGEVVVRAQRVVALPRLEGPGIAGLASDDHGFIPVDGSGRVTGTRDVFAAGDGTTYEIKQGGIAAQQADAVARTIAARAGADVEEQPFRPVLRAKLLTGSQAKYLRQAVAGEDDGPASEASDETLWWPPTKVAAPHLSPYLEGLDRGGAEPEPAGGDGMGGIEILGR
jgi:sulfide:quinone oxidoreductase